MKSPTVASRKKVTPENLARLGAERLAEIVAAAAATRPELKRRLRMELAAEQGAEHLAVEIDRRLGSLQASGSKVSWRQRPTFVRDLDGLRTLIAGRLGELDPGEALGRLWLFMDLARPVGSRVKDRDGELAAVFRRAAGDLGALLARFDPAVGAADLTAAVARSPAAWAGWLPDLLPGAPAGLAVAALGRLSEAESPTSAWLPVVRQLADAAGDVDAFRSTFTPAGLKSPSVAAEVAGRLLASGRVEEAGTVLKAAPGRGQEPDEGWEGAWIDYLERSGDPAAAQAARWSSFERTLSVARARAFVARLTGFDDVEAEARAAEHAAAHPDARLGLQFLMEWPALLDAARMIESRRDELQPTPEQAQLWASRLRARHPNAAGLLLRKAAADAFRRREFATCDRLTEEADAIAV
jgi:hypothetical protein